MKKILSLIIFSVLLLGLAYQLNMKRLYSTFKENEVFGLKGYLKTNKGQYAFYWKNIVRKGVKSKILIFGDFQNANIFYAYPQRVGNLSDNNRKLNMDFNIFNSHGKLDGSKQKIVIRILNNKQYSIKLKSNKEYRIPGISGKTYKFTQVYKSPASEMLDKYSRKKVFNKIHKGYKERLYYEYLKEKGRGKNVKDPRYDKKLKSDVLLQSHKDTNKELNFLKKEFSYE